MREVRRPNEDELDEKGKSRRNFLKAAVAGLGLIATEEAIRRNVFSGNSTDSRARRNNNREIREADLPRLKAIKEFENLGDGVLVICADTGDDDEYGSVVETLTEHSQKRVEGMKFTVHRNEDGTATAEIPVRKKEDKGLPPGQYPSGVNKIKITVIKQHSPSLARLGSNYGVIQLRGHTQHMPALLEEFQKHRKEEVILSMGGCESVQFMKDVYNPQTAIIADKMGTPAFTKHNTYVLVSTLDRLATSGSWEELQGKVSQISQRFREQTIMPGDPEFYKYVAGEKTR